MTKIIEQSLSGSRGDNQKRIAEFGLDFVETILRKNHDYGSSVWEPPVLLPDLSPCDAILIRMGDKIQRIKSLIRHPPEVASESLDDTIKDLGAYCLLLLSRPKS